MFYLIGLGLKKEDITLRALNVLKKCKKIYIEKYTTELPYKVKELEKLIKKRLVVISRKDVEENGKRILEEALKNDIALLVYGDPLAATTHFSLVLEAEKMKVKYEIVHSVSILNAIANSGLHLYKFGKVVSLPKWSRNYEPKSFIDKIKENLRIGAHTLILVDKDLEVEKALKQLSLDKELLNKQLIIASMVGTSEEKFLKGKLNEFLKKSSIKKIKKPYCFVIPSQLHFTEEKALEKIKDVSDINF